ncbi:hypothetical protein SpCBS45565_g04405 [Spizellomyces sp. 'palustris']|nr:hypothetical protein SpCBS45565_g04405 [Spizellomyces sp. 'palustris']
MEGDSRTGGLVKDHGFQTVSERAVLYERHKDVAAVCTHNNITLTTYTTTPPTSLSLCFYNLPSLSVLTHFTSLTSLCIVAQDITSLKGLNACPFLERLWVCETFVEVLEGLEGCRELRELFLYTNRIRRIEGLDACTKLQVLWLCDNDISTLENISGLKHLKQLHLGNNRIESVGDALDENIALENLNLSGNAISSFRQVMFLSRLPNLHSLCLSDPNFAENPICGLSNYQTHVIYHLPNLKWLDTLQVTEESRRIINATVMKKRMYYNMRIRTIKRNTNFLLKVLETRTSDASHLESDLRTLIERVKKVVKRQDDLVGSTIPNPDIRKWTETLHRLNHFITTKSNTLQHLHMHKTQLLCQIIDTSDMAIRKLLLELETGGNVRFEQVEDDNEVVSRILENSSVNVHCISRVHNRFLRNQFEAATKPDDPFTYLCFQSQDIFSIVEYGFCEPVTLTQLLTVNETETGLCQAILVKTLLSDPKEKDSYTFSPTQPLLPEYLLEYTLQNAEKLSTVEQVVLDTALSNRLSLAGMPGLVSDVTSRMQDGPILSLQDLTLSLIESQYPEIKVANDVPISSIDSTNPPIGETLNLSFTSNPLPTPYTHIKTLRLSHCKLTSIPPLPPHLETLDVSFNNLDSLTACIGVKYLDAAGNHVRDVEGLVELFQGSALLTLDTRFNPVCKSKGYRAYIHTRLPHIQILDGIPYPKTEKAPQPLSLPSILNHASTQPHLFRPLSVRTQAGYGFSAGQNEYWRLSHSAHLNESVILEAITTLELDSCQLFDLEVLPLGLVNLRWASFRNNNLRDISKLAQYTHLEELVLENNEIESMDALTALKNLIKLDVSINRISSVECARDFASLMCLSLENNCVGCLRPLAELPTLMEFYCGNNSIGDLLNIFPLKALPRLIILDFTGNTVCHVDNYRLFTIYHLTRLKILDGTGISPKEQTLAREAYLGKLTIELLGEKIGHLTFKNICELDLRNCKIREIDCFADCDFRNLRKLVFDNNLLTNIDCFVGLTGLKTLSLNNNRIERLLSTDLPAPLTSPNGIMRLDTPEYGRQRTVKTLLPNLEELSLGYNCISRIADLALYQLAHLKMLYLHGNRISKVDGLEHMTNLIELVLDRNQIKGVDPSSFVSLINLKELHIKENRIKSLSHFDCLPNLQHLHLANNRVHDTSEIEKMKLPSLIEISLAANAVARKQMYRYALVIRFPQIMGIDGKDVTLEERQRAEMYFMEQCMLREDPSPLNKMVGHSVSSIPGTQTVNGIKLPIKITSVVLDGLEMKLAAHSSGFGSSARS